MKVELINHTPLWVASKAIRTCWDSHNKSDTEVCYGGELITGDKDKELIHRVGNKMKHESVKNHINYVFDIKGITTKTLLALTRHDIGTEFSVQSTRYTTAKSVNNRSAGYTESRNKSVNFYLDKVNDMVEDLVQANVSNDEISLLLPQAWKYNLVATFSMSALQHFLELRTKKDAHWDIQDLASKLKEAIPEEHIYLFEEK